MFSYQKDILDIVVIAGQSNAEGNGISTLDYAETRNNVYQLVDANNCYLQLGDPKHVPVICHLPTECKIEVLQERLSDAGSVADLSFGFVDEYIKNGYLKPGHRLMVVKAAVGGTGFALKQQGLHYNVYQRLLNMVDYALSLNPKNQIVAFLWHQGEHDVVENSDLSNQERYDFYHHEFMAQMNDFLTRYHQFHFPVISGEFVNEWTFLPEYKDKVPVIESCLADCMKEIGFAAFVSSEGLKSNNEVLHNQDNIHFCKDSVIELGKRYFTAYQSLVQKEK